MAITLECGPYTYELAEGYQWGQIASVTVDSQDRVYVYTRTEHPLMIFDRDGNFLRSWGEDLLKDAHGICLDAQDNMYMVDRESQVAMTVHPRG